MTHSAQKAMLTRAIRSGDPDRVIAAATFAVNEWDKAGFWPDDWSRWQRALDDSQPWNQRIDLDSLR